MLQHRLATPVIQPRMHFFDKEGKPLIGGKVYSFKVGEDIFKPTYRNSEFTAANQNPILLDQAGSALIYVRGSVQLKIYDKSGVFIEEKIVYQQQMRTQFFDKYGKALGGGKVWTYDYQSTIKKPSYENADDTLLNPNPVVLDENGYSSISIVGAYRLRQYDKNGVFVADQDFKRPPANVLTSPVYPPYFTDGFLHNLALNPKEATLWETLRRGAVVELFQSAVSISGATVRTPLNNTGMMDTFSSAVLIVAATKRDTLVSTITGENFLSVLAVSSATQRDALIKNTMDVHAFASGLSLAGAQFMN